MKTKRPRKFYVRKWLNKADMHTSGHVILKIECKTGEYPYIETTCIIMDCSRSVSLDFGSEMKGGKASGKTRNNQAKAHLLADQFADFAIAYDKAIEWLESVG